MANIIFIVIDSEEKINYKLIKLIEKIKLLDKACIFILNKIDLTSSNNLSYLKEELRKKFPFPQIELSAKRDSSQEIVSKLIKHLPKPENKTIVKQFINRGDLVLLIIPIDKSAPLNRLILPQQQVIRELIDAQAIVLIASPSEINSTLNSMKVPPKLVITDSQVFSMVAKLIPKDISLTSFSILFSNFKGNLQSQISATKQLDNLEHGDIILISEVCSHHIQCDDIGRVKLPLWIKNYCKKNISFEFSTGKDFPSDLSKYKLIIHCGGCMISQGEMQFRVKEALRQNIPLANYGMIIAKTHNLLERSLEIFQSKNKKPC